MRDLKFIYLLILLTCFINSCNDKDFKCEPVQEWKVQNYKIVKSKCPDLVLAFYYTYNIYDGEKKLGNVSSIDSCVFTWQAENERFVTLNTCENSFMEIVPNKILLDKNLIDSVTMYSDELKQAKRLTTKQIEKFVKDWNESKTRGYSQEPFDSSFYRLYPYQYRLTIFSKGKQRPFYCYNYLILDSSNWEYEMSKNSDLKYFHKYWKN